MEKRSHQRSLITDFLAFHNISARDTVKRFKGLRGADLLFLSGCWVIEKDNGGYFTYYDCNRYLNLNVGYIQLVTRRLRRAGYLEGINKAEFRYARRYRLTVSGNNALVYYNRCVISLYDKRQTLQGSESVLFSSPEVQSYYHTQALESGKVIETPRPRKKKRSRRKKKTDNE